MYRKKETCLLSYLFLYFMTLLYTLLTHVSRKFYLNKFSLNKSLLVVAETCT